MSHPPIPPPFATRIARRNLGWSAARITADPDAFARLQGTQHPELLLFTCCDHRVPVPDLLDLPPGSAFVYRNIANRVPYGDHGVRAALTYAVDHLHVPHVVVCGHDECGGVRAAMSDAPLDYPLDAWLRPVRALYDQVRPELEALDPPERLRRMVELNVRAQCQQLRAILHDHDPAPMVHGWVYTLSDGTLRMLEPNAERVTA